MSGPKLTREELEARQKARGEVTIDTLRDVMCFENPHSRRKRLLSLSRLDIRSIRTTHS